MTSGFFDIRVKDEEGLSSRKSIKKQNKKTVFSPYTYARTFSVVIILRNGPPEDEEERRRSAVVVVVCSCARV